MQQRRVVIGGSEQLIRPFSAYKASLAGDVVAGASDKLRLVMEKIGDFERDYGKRHFVEIDRGMAAIRGYDIPEEAFVDGAVKLPDKPDQMEVFGGIFPEAWATARTELLKLLALAIVNNDELIRKEPEGEAAVQQMLDEEGKKLLMTASMGEIITAAATVIDHVKEELAEREDDLGKLRAALRRGRPAGAATAVQEPEELTPATVVSAPEESDSPNSPTPSPEPPAGPATT